MSVIQSAISAVRKKADEILGDNQGWFRGGQFTPVQQINTISQNPTVQRVGSFLNRGMEANQAVGNQIINTPNTVKAGLSNYSENLKLVSNPNTQPQVTEGLDPVRQFAINRFVAPMAQVPYNIKETFGGQDKNILQRGIHGLSAVAGLIPGVDDVLYAGYDYLKGVSAQQLQGVPTVQSYKNGIDYLTGQKMVGLGDALTTDPTKRDILNIAELPATLIMAGKINKSKATREAILRAEPEIRQLSNVVKLSDKGVADISKSAIEYAERMVDAFLPNIKKSPQLKAIKENDPRDWVRAVTPFIEDVYMKAKHPQMNLGFNVNTLKRLDEAPKPSQLEPKIEGAIGTPPKIAPSLDSGVDKAVSTGQLSPTKVQTELPETNKVSQTNVNQTPLSLPEGKPQQIVVKTRTQLKKVLAKNPNANVRIELKPEKGKITTYGEIPTKEEVQATLPTRINQFTEDVLGFSTKPPKGGTKGANLWTRTLRKGQEAISTKVEEGLASENSLVRNSASFIQNFFRGLGMSPERAAASAELRGEIASANDNGYKIMDSIYQIIGNNKKSLERINAVLDPDIAKTKVTFDQLSDTEKQAYNLLREGFDLVHDISYANGHISSELYVANKGRYTPRMYETTELPPEVNEFLKQGKRINNSIYKGRKDIDAWKKDNSLNDPVYALGKRLSQVQTNTAIKKYTDFLASNERFISDTPRPGFTKLSDSPAYGNLSGKYVMNSAAEDLKGFFFANQAVQYLYNVFRAYDRMPIRQLQKQLLTVFNPTTNVGNIVSDQVFGFLTGVDPLTLNKNLVFFKNNPAEYKRLSSYLMNKNIVGIDITRTDFLDRLGSIDSLSAGKKIGIVDKVKQFYGGTDDVYKTSAFKALLDKGYSLEEATRRVADGFQNYSNVGKFYDVAAKTPIIGKPFIKFQGDLIRIIKNGAINNPLGLITFLGTLKGISYLFSKMSGESDEDRETRENRFAAPMISGLNIPLTWQTPIGEINVARYISPFYANNETTNIASNMLPFVPNIEANKDLASNVAMNVNDPLLSPFVQAGLNRDFRGERIADPNETKWQQSTLTPSEQLGNKAKFVGRAYLPPPVNSLIDVGAAVQGKPNMYGTPQTVGQAVARLGGVKISQYGPEEVQALREKDAKYDQKGNEYIRQQINSVTKQQLKGEITPQQAEKRIKYLEGQMKQVDTSLIKGSRDSFAYINDNGNLATIDLTKYDDINNLPTTNRYQSAIRESKQYSEAAKILDNTNLSTEQQQTALTRLGISPDKASYYQVANDNDNLKTMFVLDAINKVKTQGGGLPDVLQLIANQRTDVNGKMIASNGVLDNLVDEGILTYAQAKELKKYKMENGQLVSKSKSVGRAKKVTLRKMSTPKAPKMPKVKGLKVPKLSYKKMKPRKLRVLKVDNRKVKVRQ